MPSDKFKVLLLRAILEGRKLLYDGCCPLLFVGLISGEIQRCDEGSSEHLLYYEEGIFIPCKAHLSFYKKRYKEIDKGIEYETSL